MFDTMTFTKAGAAVCGALLIFLFSNWAAEGLYHTESAEAHGDEHAEGEEAEGPVRGYMIADLSALNAEGGAEPEPELSFEEAWEMADAGAGERVYTRCRSCHALDGSNGTGPHLDGVVNRAVASVDGYAYSGPMGEHGGDWTPERLSVFLENPRGVVDGTKMTFSGLNDIEDRVNLIAFLQEQ